MSKDRLTAMAEFEANVKDAKDLERFRTCGCASCMRQARNILEIQSRPLPEPNWRKLGINPVSREDDSDDDGGIDWSGGDDNTQVL